ncbi:hypothetical protein SAY86_026994 [Trapa natans]|uniref:Amino acid transporter transmembrane domain-containing protein n=1 Tax=Trapa natans TaxID=22666 RepID=A0AAN7QIL3_TRANT|nr:hypothetical protein SAY86_026994 [Trapa natans]
MKNSDSDQSFYIDSEEEDEENVYEKSGDGGDNGNDSDSSASSAEDRRQNKPSSYNTSWPQSYRQSIDLYSSVPSPNIGFLGTPNLSRISGASYLSSSLTRRHTPVVLPSVIKPLLPEPGEEEQQHLPKERRSSYSLLPPLPRKASARKDERATPKGAAATAGQSSNGQTVLNGINVLCGVGILSTPYAASEGGWAGLAILLIFAVISYYTGILLRYCLDSQPRLETYPDIGQAAFGTAGRIAISIILYIELYVCCVEYIILESDNLSSLFPNAHINLGGFELDSHHLFALMTALAVLPTVWLRDLSVLSYISAGGVVASVLIVLCLFWVGLVDHVDLHSRSTTTLNLSGLPVAVGLYGFLYSGHAVLPNIYTSMKQPNQYPSVLLTSFGICTCLYAGVAVMGYLMFGGATLSQFTLNMPKGLVASKVAVWTTVRFNSCRNIHIPKESLMLSKTPFMIFPQVVNPFTKYALTMSPVAMCLEELIPSTQSKSHMYAIVIRTALVMSTLFVALSVPFFGLVMSLIGSLLTMLVTLILPCACFLSILKERVTRFQRACCCVIILVGVMSSIFGTYSALSKIIENLSS